MDTVVIPAYDASGQLQEHSIAAAAELLKAGELVAFPTETVYGLGANALDEKAVAGIFEAKGRPSNNPLIVHVASIAEARSLVENWSDQAQLLAEAFWPGPLTLVLKKRSLVPSIVTAGGDTVAIRIPSHPVALELLKKCGFPLAAPSANRSNQLSPTTAEHVLRGMRNTIQMIIDGGPCEAGIESTVLNLADDYPEILRPGVLSANFLSEVLGTNIQLATQAASATTEAMLSPGQLSTHYAPATDLLLVEVQDMERVLGPFWDKGKRIGIMSIATTEAVIRKFNNLVSVAMPATPEEYARQLYAVLHDLDEKNLDVILCELPPHAPEWEGVQDRLSRAGRKAGN